MTKKIEVSIEKSDWYPFYIFDTEDLDFHRKYDSVAKIPVEKFDWLKRVMKEFEKSQEYLKKLHG